MQSVTWGGVGGVKGTASSNVFTPSLRNPKQTIITTRQTRQKNNFFCCCWKKTEFIDIIHKQNKVINRRLSGCEGEWKCRFCNFPVASTSLFLCLCIVHTVWSPQSLAHVYTYIYIYNNTFCLCVYVVYCITFLLRRIKVEPHWFNITRPRLVRGQ